MDYSHQTQMASPQTWQRANADVRVEYELDSAFNKLISQLEAQCNLLNKQAAVRAKSWMKKLSLETSNVVWKKNRNQYARLLLDQLKHGRLETPFDKLPPSGPLPTLNKSLLYSISKPAKSPKHNHHPVSPSDALDDYIGRQGLAKLKTTTSTATPTSDTMMIPALRLHTTRTAISPTDEDTPSPSYNYNHYEPSKLELEAKLGASKEIQAELEWRLRLAEEQIRRQGKLIEQLSMASGNAISSSIDNNNDDGYYQQQPSARRAVEEEQIKAAAFEFQQHHAYNSDHQLAADVETDTGGYQQTVDKFQQRTTELKQRLHRNINPNNKQQGEKRPVTLFSSIATPLIINHQSPIVNNNNSSTRSRSSWKDALRMTPPLSPCTDWDSTISSLTTDLNTLKARWKATSSRLSTPTTSSSGLGLERQQLNDNDDDAYLLGTVDKTPVAQLSSAYQL